MKQAVCPLAEGVSIQLYLNYGYDILVDHIYLVMVVVLYVRKGPLQSVHVLRHLTVKVKYIFGGLGERVFTGPKIVILKNHLTLYKRGINATIEHWVQRSKGRRLLKTGITGQSVPIPRHSQTRAENADLVTLEI